MTFKYCIGIPPNGEYHNAVVRIIWDEEGEASADMIADEIPGMPLDMKKEEIKEE